MSNDRHNSYLADILDNSFFVLNITSVPPGEAPEWVRQKWVGLSLPLAQQSASAKVFPTMGVMTMPKGFFGRFFAWFFGRLRPEVGYLVDSSVAISLLELEHPEAASWWRENTPLFLQSGQYFVFQEEVGHVVSQSVQTN